MSNKLLQVAKYFIELDKAFAGEDDSYGVSNLKLQKLVYYAQGFHLAIFGKKLFKDEIKAWLHGPVVPKLYHQCKKFGNSCIDQDHFANIDTDELNEDEKELIEEVFEVYGQYTAWKLRNLTHSEPPWMDYQEGRGVIPESALKDYFQTRLIAA